MQFASSNDMLNFYFILIIFLISLSPKRTKLLVKPTKLTIIKPPTPVVAGEMVSLTCTVDGSRPRSTITWFNRSQPVQQTPVENTELMDDGTYRTSATLVFIATRFDHESEFFCKGTNDVLKSKNEVPLLQAIQLQVLCKFFVCLLKFPILFLYNFFFQIFSNIRVLRSTTVW